MSWCDKLASVPTIGLKVDPYYGGNETILTQLAPLVAKWGTPDKPKFKIEVPDIHRVDIQRDDGFLYGFDANLVFVQFQHRMKFQPTSGGLPVAELISSQNSFTSLLDEAIERLIEAATLLPEAGTRRIQRIGVISTTSVSDEDLPPGIVRFIEYVGKPWSGDISGYDFRLVSNLDEDPSSTTRCIHNFKKPEDPEALLTLSFDWQKILKKPAPLTAHEIKRQCATVKEGALNYFEELAVGDAINAGA